MRQLRQFLALLLPTCLAASANAQVITLTDQISIPSMSTNWTESRTLDQFDPALGTLLSIRLSSVGTIVGSIGYESRDASPATVSLEWSARITAARADTGEILLTSSPTFLDVSTVTAFDQDIDNRGTSGNSFPNLFEMDTDDQTFFPPFSADVTNLFIGTGTIGLDFAAVGTASASGPGNVVVGFSTDAGIEFTVIYEYQGIPDCNDNGIDDADDIANMTSNDCNGNSIPDECEFDCNDNGIPDDCDPEECPCFEFNRRQPGSLLLFPEYRSGPGKVTLFTVTNANCNSLGGVTNIEFRYIDGDSCLEANQTEFLTPCDTYTYLTSSHGVTGEGYAYVYAKKATNSKANPAGIPQVFNHLTGNMIVIDAFSAFDYSVNAVSFKGVGLQGTPTDRDGPGGNGDGIRDLDNTEYEPAPDRLYLPRFMGQDAGLQGIRSELILINLSGGSAFRSSPLFPSGGTLVSILGYNDNEVVFSAEYPFSCWDRVNLSSISNAFSNSSLRGLNDDPNEILGASHREAGWFKVEGAFSSSTVESIMDPAIYAVLVERIRTRGAADLPFEFCSQENGDLLPGNIFGDFPFVAGDNQ